MASSSQNPARSTLSIKSILRSDDQTGPQTSFDLSASSSRISHGITAPTVLPRLPAHQGTLHGYSSLADSGPDAMAYHQTVSHASMLPPMHTLQPTHHQPWEAGSFSQQPHQLPPLQYQQSHQSHQDEQHWQHQHQQYAQHAHQPHAHTDLHYQENQQLPPFHSPYSQHQHQQQHEQQHQQHQQHQQQWQHQHLPQQAPHSGSQQLTDQRTLPRLAPLLSSVLPSISSISQSHYLSPAQSLQERDRYYPPSPPVSSSTVPGPYYGYRAASTHSPDHTFSSPRSAGSDVRRATPPPEPRRVGASSTVYRRAPMRSSIACAPCRRSKVKCDNDGEGKAACEACLKAMRDCHYPAPGTSWMFSPRTDLEPDLQFVSAAASGVAKTPASTLNRDVRGPSAERYAAERKRQKQNEDSFRLDPLRYGAYYVNEILSASYLTETMWSEIFEIFKLNFSPELPFLHVPTLKEQLTDKFKASGKSRSDGTNLLLLGVLVLTSRFHADLVKYISHAIASRNGVRMRGKSAKPNPFGTSEYFADALARTLGPLPSCMATVSLERVQAFLMLGLYEWSQSAKKNSGVLAWMYIGVAIRMAQALGMCSAEQPSSLSPPCGTAGVSSSSSESVAIGQDLDTLSAEANAKVVVRQEVRRRTMFSCFVLDRLTSCGKGRIPTIRSEDLQIRLPCSEESFALGEKVRTEPLQPCSADKKFRPYHGSMLARYISLVDIWGEISKYTFSGGRLVEKKPPWEDTKFRRLRKALESFYEALPDELVLSSKNYQSIESRPDSVLYVSLHMLGAVCHIMLHREYVPFIPIRCCRPVGPLDAPTFPEGSAPAGFWDESAQQMFKAARDIMALTEMCMARRKVPMSALTVYSVWTAAFVGIYARQFPHMDTNKYMSWDEKDGTTAMADYRRGPEDAGASGHGAGYGAGAGAGAGAGGTTGAGTGTEEPIRLRTPNGPTGTAYGVLRTMSRWLHTAAVYVKCFHSMNSYYDGVKRDFEEHVRRYGDRPDATRGIRQGGPGGGLEEWKVLSMQITNNGSFVPGEASDSMEGPDVAGTSPREAEAVGSAAGSGSGASAPGPGPGPAGSSGGATTASAASATESHGGYGGRAGDGLSEPAWAAGARKRKISECEVITVEDDDYMDDALRQWE